MNQDKKITLGVIVGNRGFFPDSLIEEGREKILKVLKNLGYETVALTLEDTEYGAVETREDAKVCAKLFAKNRGKIDGISVETVDLSEIIGRAESLDTRSKHVKKELEEIKQYINTEGIPEEALVKIARLSKVLHEWIRDNELDATAIQCWSALEEFYGVVPCTAMSMMSEGLLPSACEVDVMGALSMYALQLASGKPAALLDWNNNYGEEENKVVTFHCSNLPASFFEEVKMGYQDILAEDVGKENTYGTCVGRIAAGPVTFFRLSTDDVNGKITSYLAEGRYTDDKLNTFGGYGVAEINRLQKLLDYIALGGFEHHVAVTQAQVGKVLEEAIGKYLRWDFYRHKRRMD